MSDSKKITGIVSWIEHSGPDSSAAKKFYQDILGWQIAEMPMQDGSSYTGIMAGESAIGGFSPRSDSSAAWTIFISVDDVDGKTQKAKNQGATILSGPMSIPGVGRMTTLLDPQGARISLFNAES